MSVAFSTVVFDLDGTLADTAPAIAQALNRLLVEFDRPALPLPTVRGMIGDGTPMLIRKAMAATGGDIDCPLNDLSARMGRYQESSEFSQADLYPGILDVLSFFESHAVRMAVCTNKPARAAHHAIEQLGLRDRFGALVGGDTLPERKPDPAPVLDAVSRVGGRPVDTVMVGDSVNDALAARAAGVACVLVSFGYAHGPVREMGADLVIDAFADLPAALGPAGPVASAFADRQAREALSA